MNQNLIVKVFEGSKVFFMEDGYINATKVARRFKKQASKWLENIDTQEYIKAISKKLLLERNQLVIVRNGGNTNGTWLHPKLAVRFARWLSLEFEIWCDEQIEQIIHLQQQTPEQQRIQQILKLLHDPVNTLSFEQISLSERLAQRRFVWREFQEFFGMKSNTWFLRSLLGVVNRRVLGMSAARFRVQVLRTNNRPNNLTKDFLPKPHQECIQQIMQELLEYFQARPNWTKLQVQEKVLELIKTKISKMERLIGRNLQELVLECIEQVRTYSQAHDISPYEVIRNNLIQLNYDQLALERELRRFQLQLL